MESRDQAYQMIGDVLADRSTAGADALAALAFLPGLRDELDVLERGLIDAARHAGASWTGVAAALRLRSRQAAEQRRLRLGGAQAGIDPGAIRAQRRRQRSVDNSAGAGAIKLRAAAADLADTLTLSPPGPRLGLALSTLRIAVDADPGGLVDLVRLALADLDADASLRPETATQLAAVRSALESIRLKKG
ncbi:MAG TPA: hypothetical protein VGF84_02620 [Micromonosporaceae bacterium]